MVLPKLKAGQVHFGNLAGLGLNKFFSKNRETVKKFFTE